MILSWLVDADTLDYTLNGILIQEDSIAEKISSACLDENVYIESCKKYFTEDAWSSVQATLLMMKSNPVWYCGQCSGRIDNNTEESIVCDSCLNWNHFDCANIKTRPKCKFWFCSSCNKQKHL